MSAVISSRERTFLDPAIWLEGFLAVGIFLLLFWPDKAATKTLCVIFSGIMLEALPFMLCGALVGGLIEVFLSRERVLAMLPRRNWLTVLAAGGLGLILPVCECSIVPVVRRLAGKGLPPAAAIAFLLGAPVANPIVAASTALAYQFDWTIALLRAGLGYAIAVSVALLMGRLFRRSGPLLAEIVPAPCACGCGHDHAAHEHNGAISAAQPLIRRLGQALRHATDDFMGVGHYLVIGAFVAALAQTFISKQAFAVFQDNLLIPVFAMILLAFLLNLCSEADAFVASSFQGLLPLPAQMAFMLAGPVLDLKLLLMYRTVFCRRAIWTLAGLILSAVSLVSILLALFWRAS